MRFVGIDVAAETHMVAAVDDAERIVLKPTPFGEDAAGYEKLFKSLGEPGETLVAMEATGHYWCNLFTVHARRAEPVNENETVGFGI